MKKVLLLSTLVVLLITACKKDNLDMDETTQSLETEDAASDRASPDRVAICHVNPQGTVSLKFVKADKVQGHLDHGDQLATAYYTDNDGDGYGTGEPQYGCEPIEGLVDLDGDCDDTNAAINPGAAEVCDNLDNDCNGQADDGLPTTTYYEDADGDGYGLNESTFTGCSQPAGYAAQDGDCDDSNAAINPGAEEVCGDGIDQDCDGSDASCVSCSVFTAAELDNLLTYNPNYGWWLDENTCYNYPLDLYQEVYLFMPATSGSPRGGAATYDFHNGFMRVSFSNDLLGIFREQTVSGADMEGCRIILKEFMDEMKVIYGTTGPIWDKCAL